MIHWMFSIPRGSLYVLIYIHRCQPDILAVILRCYLREFRGKLEGRKARRAERDRSRRGCGKRLAEPRPGWVYFRASAHSYQPHPLLGWLGLYKLPAEVVEEIAAQLNGRI